MFGFESIRGSGSETFIERPETGFSELEIGYGCRATITSGETYSVVIQIDDNLADFLVVEQVGERLAISLEPYKSYRSFTFSADITMPDIDRLELSGGTKGQLNGFDLAHDIEIDLSGGSELTGDLSSDKIAFSLSGGSEAKMFGDCTDASLSGSGGSWFGLEQFRIQNLTFNLSGGSTGRVAVSGNLAGSASGGSSIQYTGDPSLGKISKSGGSSVSKR
jgi:hypothetical protein